MLEFRHLDVSWDSRGSVDRFLDCVVVLLYLHLRFVNRRLDWCQEMLFVLFDHVAWHHDLERLHVWHCRVDTSAGRVTIAFSDKVHSYFLRANICTTTWTLTMNIVACKFLIEDHHRDVGNGAKVLKIDIAWWVDLCDQHLESILNASNSENNGDNHEEHQSIVLWRI